ncbi:hypothetical protein N864_21630 [Intrasporangium chromatireducens Q5-1]|uniref:Uncharacterized protein n=1 Tax=Intrasporangium chromatireducens Q5-1 TaxID=584657 RepID=W9GNL2_9MICO|nr:hypothetical protein [Intrasporangium chromatireducens]EWT06413.1 hypothetical protein N864_21630 [Intrasporangium chromatireducens Q5-1]
MTTLTHPSVQFPGPPTVSLDVPDGWVPVHRPGLLLAAKLPREQAFAPNVVVNVEAYAPGLGVDAPMARMREMARSRSGHASEPYAAQLGDREFVGLDSSWPDDEVETILQANLFHVVEPEGGTGPRWLVQLTGAVGGPTAEQDYDLVRKVLLTTTVSPWQPEGDERP